MPSIAAETPVHVAAGIIADRGRFFLTRRPSGAHQGDRWEFPGGKVGADEDVLAALRRELNEEIGIDVVKARPFMQVRHDYPDKSVLLDTWLVTSYTGTPHGREGQATRWATRSDLLALEFPAADLPIQRRLWLPTLYAVSDCARLGRSEFLTRLECALDAGLSLLQLREPQMTEAELTALARDVVSRCHGHGAKVLLNASPDLAERCQADGVHLNIRRLMRLSKRPLSSSHFVAASCHNERELEQARNLGVDLVVIGPVAHTTSHPGAVPIGWDRLEALSRAAGSAVYAIGGMRAGDLLEARRRGAQGVAMISGLWESDDPATAIAAADGPIA